MTSVKTALPFYISFEGISALYIRKDIVNDLPVWFFQFYVDILYRVSISESISAHRLSV